MGNQRKLIEQMQRYLLNTIGPALDAARREPADYARLRSGATSLLDQIGTGDLRNVRTGDFWNMSSLADRTNRRNLLYDAGATGQAALGTAPSKLLSLNKMNADAHAERDYASEFQDEIEQQTSNARSTLEGLGQAEQNRNLGVLGPLTNLYNTASTQKKPKNFLESLLKGGLTALPGILKSFI